MDIHEFNEAMESIDRDLTSKSIRVPSRAFEAFRILASGYAGPMACSDGERQRWGAYEGPNLYTQICEWYKARYADRFYDSNDVGRVPLMIRRQIYILRIREAFGTLGVSITDVLSWIEGITDAMRTSLSNQELASIWNRFRDGYALTYELNDATMVAVGRKDLCPPELALFEKALRDLETGVRCLSRPLDPNGACFHAQQHAEKMLKVFLLYKRVCSEEAIRKCGHDMVRLLRKCEEADTEFCCLTSDICLLKNVRMDVRYNAPQVSAEAAVETYWAALRVGGFCATRQSGLPRRRMHDRH
jgi:HEPN domain-containing protein